MARCTIGLSTNHRKGTNAMDTSTEYFMLYIDGMNAGDWFDLQEAANAYFQAEVTHLGRVLTLMEYFTGGFWSQEILTNKTPGFSTVFQA